MLDISEMLLNRCIKKYIDVAARANDDVRYGTAPESMMIVYFDGKPNEFYHFTSNIKCAWQYKDGSIKKVSTDTEFKKEPVSGMYYNEAYAEFGYDLNSLKAFINVCFGPLFARGFKYTIVKNGNEYEIKDEVLVWMS